MGKSMVSCRFSLKPIHWTLDANAPSVYPISGVEPILKVPRDKFSCCKSDSSEAESPQTYGFVWKCCVPLNPMVLLIIIPIKNGYFIGNIPYFQTNPYTNKCFLSAPRNINQWPVRLCPETWYTSSNCYPILLQTHPSWFVQPTRVCWATGIGSRTYIYMNN